MPQIKNVKVKCGHCGAMHASPIFIGSTEALDNSIISGNMMKCSECQKIFKCNRENFAYTLADGSGGSVGADFIDNKVS